MPRVFNRMTRCRQKGFTLIELVTVITVVVIIGAMSTGFISSTVSSYVSTERNLDLAGQADFALRRISRDVRNALPNSVRVTTSGQNSYLEFIPISGAGRYRSGLKLDGSGNFLDFEAADTSFEILGPALDIPPDSKVVIYNLGISGVDAYEGTNTANMTANGNSLQSLTFTATKFPQASPNNRFFTVRGAISYVCDLASGQLLLFTNYTILQFQPSSVASLESLTNKQIVVNGLSACSISYAPGVLQRSGVVTIALRLQAGSAQVNLMHIVTVVNSP